MRDSARYGKIKARCNRPGSLATRVQWRNCHTVLAGLVGGEARSSPHRARAGLSLAGSTWLPCQFFLAWCWRFRAHHRLLLARLAISSVVASSYCCSCVDASAGKSPAADSGAGVEACLAHPREAVQSHVELASSLFVSRANECFGRPSLQRVVLDDGTELRYDPGFALQFRGVRVLNVRVTQFWTPHSGRNFMPSATAPLKYTKGRLRHLGVQVSDRYSGVAKQRASNMQRDTCSGATPSDSLAENGCVEQIWECQKKEGAVWWHCCGSECTRRERTGAGDATTSGRRPAGRRRICRGRPKNTGTRSSRKRRARTNSRRGTRTELNTFGDIPRKTRQALRVEVEQGFCVSFVGKKRIQTLRKFGAQYAASFHCLVEQWKDCEELRPKPKEKWFAWKRRAKHRTEWCAEANKFGA